MDKERFEYIIIRYLNGIATPDEETELLAAIRSSEELYAAFRQKTSGWNPMEEKNAGTDRKWNRLASVIAPEAADIPALTLPSSSRRTMWFSIAAAILLLCVSGITVFVLNLDQAPSGTYTTGWLTVAADEDDHSCTLPDGTSVYLRKGSSLGYPAHFDSSTRKVSIRGEAFFDVTPDPRKPFIVDASKLSVKVLGTSFSVYAPTGGTTITVTLVKGSVGLNDSNQKELIRLHPNQKADYTVSSGQYTVSEVDSERQTSWRKGIISYDNASLDEITGLIEQAYNVSLQDDKPEDDTQRFSGAFLKTQKLNTVLDQTNKLTGANLTPKH